MSIRAYFHGSIIDSCQRRQDKNGNIAHFFGDHYFHVVGGSYFIELDDFCTSAKIPEILRAIINEFSIRDYKFTTPRELGIYLDETRFGDAKAEFAWRGGYAEISGCGSDLDKLLQLIAQIKAGTIRPAISYEAKQAGQSMGEQLKAAEEKISDLTSELNRQKELLDATTVAKNNLHEQLDEKQAHVRDLYDELQRTKGLLSEFGINLGKLEAKRHSKLHQLRLRLRVKWHAWQNGHEGDSFT